MDRAELQAVQLALALALGMSLGLFYDAYRVWFRSIRHPLWRGIGDIVWWAAAFGCSAAALYYINGMQLRLPVLALALAGVCLYMGFFSPVIFPLLSRLLGLLCRLVCGLLRLLGRLLALLLLPVVWVADALLRLAELLLRLAGVILRPFRRLGGRLAAALAGVRACLKKPAKEVDFAEENDI